MSTIRAKQEICLNISTVRSLTNYSTGRYCLRFSLYEIYQSPPSSHPYKYATPVSVIEYKSTISSTAQKNTPPINPLFDLGQCYYQTKPFLLKPHTETPIHQLCIFKHDINIFNSKYETDFHELTLKCLCELLSFDYSGQQAKIVGTFDGRIKGVGIGDALCIDFGEGPCCQVVGSVHSCVYQLEYVYVGGTGKKRDLGLMKDSINVDSHNQVLVVNSDGHRRSGRQQEQVLQQLMGDSMNFQRYCQLQSKQYVESLLEYLLGEVKRSQQKTSLNLQLLQQLIKPTLPPEVHLKLPLHEQHQQPSNQPPQNPLQRSLKTQSQLQIDSILDHEMKQRLSIIKAESKYYRSSQYQENDENNYNNNDNNDSIQLVVDNDDEQQQELDNKNQEDFVCIVLEEDEEDIPVYEGNRGKSRDFDYGKKNGQMPLEINLKLHPENKSGNNMSALEYNEKYLHNNNNFNYNQIQKPQKTQPCIKQQQTKNKRRKKIFVQSNPNNQNTNTNSNSNSTPSFQQMVTQHKNKTQPQQPLSAELQFSNLTLENKASVYEARFIPNTSIKHHPNHNQNYPHNPNPQKTISKVTIQQFEHLLHSHCLSIYQKWRKFISHLAQPQGLLLVNAYRAEYRKKLESLLGQSVIRFKGSLEIDIYSKEEMQRNKMAYQIRQQVGDNQKNAMVNQFRFYNKDLFSSKKPIMFEEIFQRTANTGLGTQGKQQQQPKKSFLKVSLSNNISNPFSEAQHVIFLVHGLGACRLDMEKIRVEIKRNFKEKVHIVISCSNEGRTQGNIATMGVRLAHQVQQQLAKNFGNPQTLQAKSIKLSFIGHSMGGIIIRSALPRLEKYKNLFHSFVSLSSPHLGYCYSNSKLIDVGLWLINNWQKCESILQLTMQDTPGNGNGNSKGKFNIEDTFLYRLSLEKGLEWFKKLTFLASRQDLYVPYFSARVQKHDQCISDLKTNYQYAITHSKMVDNILSRVTGTVTRIDVNFCITQQNIDNLIGRAAHISFVNNVEFLRLLTITDQNTII